MLSALDDIETNSAATLLSCRKYSDAASINRTGSLKWNLKPSRLLSSSRSMTTAFGSVASRNEAGMSRGNATRVPYGLPVSWNNRRMDAFSSYVVDQFTRGRWRCRSKTYGFRCGSWLSVEVRCGSVHGQFRFSYETDVRRVVVVNVTLVCAVDVRAAVAAKSVETSSACRTRSCHGSDVFTQQFTYRSTSVITSSKDADRFLGFLISQTTHLNFIISMFSFLFPCAVDDVHCHYTKSVTSYSDSLTFRLHFSIFLFRRTRVSAG